jgi:hypothetical protein
MITGAAAMTDMPAEATMEVMQSRSHSPGVVLRSLLIGLTAFLTVVDLFATQAILPSLARHYAATPGAMGFAVNASTIGMAVAGLVVGSFSPHIDRRTGILASLLVLSEVHQAGHIRVCRRIPLEQQGSLDRQRGQGCQFPQLRVPRARQAGHRRIHF